MFRVSTVLAFAGALLVAVALPLVAADQHVSQHEKANKLVAEQKYDRAIKLLKAANGKVGDSCLECYMGLAGAFQSTGELRKAEKQVRQAFELASDPVRKAFCTQSPGLDPLFRRRWRSPADEPKGEEGGLQAGQHQRRPE